MEARCAAGGLGEAGAGAVWESDGGILVWHTGRLLQQRGDLTSLTAEPTSAELTTWIRRHWTGESRTRLLWVRDVFFGDDAPRYGPGNGLESRPLCVNLVISKLRLDGSANIAEAHQPSCLEPDAPRQTAADC